MSWDSNTEHAIDDLHKFIAEFSRLEEKQPNTVDEMCKDKTYICFNCKKEYKHWLSGGILHLLCYDCFIKAMSRPQTLYSNKTDLRMIIKNDHI